MSSTRRTTRFAARGLLILVVASLSACDASDLAPEADSPARTYMKALDANDASAAAAIASIELADPANMAKLRIFSEPASDHLRFLSATVTSAAVVSSASPPRRTTLFYERPRGDGSRRCGGAGCGASSFSSASAASPTIGAPT
ncbi:MAG: hypothetical protein JWM77_4195 [Rhodospirillales bacterium]|nr:hypothetical protein [Rhodospirillales bacterium]